MFIFNIYKLRCLLYFVVVVLSCCASLCSEFRVVMSLTISSWKRFSVRLCLQLFVGGLMSCFRYLCLFTYSGVQHILCSVFVLFVVVLCTLCCQFLWIVHCWLPIRYSLTFIVSHFSWTLILVLGVYNHSHCDAFLFVHKSMVVVN